MSAAILREFGRARQHLQLTFAIKFLHWRQLPWVLLGIARPDRAIARACGERALLLSASASQDARSHLIVPLLCPPDSPSCAELRSFVYQHIGLEHQPLLQRMCGKFLSTPIAERRVESQHAAAKRDLKGAPHYSCVRLAWKSIRVRLRCMVRKDPRNILRFADLCRDVKRQRLALVRMGFWLHPAVLEKLQQEQ